MEVIRSASQMNQEGANFLGDGKEKEALEAFSQGLHLVTDLASEVGIDQLRIMQFVEQQQQQQQLLACNQKLSMERNEQQRQKQQEQPNIATKTTTTTDGTNTNEIAFAPTNVPPSSSSTASTETATEKLSSGDNCCSCSEEYRGNVVFSDVLVDGFKYEQYYVHDKAIIFFPPTISPYENLTLYSAILLFNMGLCYHRRYMTTQKDIMKNMALQLYDGCCQSMKEYCYNRRSSTAARNNPYYDDNNAYVFLLINALNNQGQLYLDYSDRRYKYISEEMTYIIRNSKRVHEIHSEILLNILMCTTLKGCGTAAA